jgi:hypothetical protein
MNDRYQRFDSIDLHCRAPDIVHALTRVGGSLIATAARSLPRNKRDGFIILKGTENKNCPFFSVSIYDRASAPKETYRAHFFDIFNCGSDFRNSVGLASPEHHPITSTLGRNLTP